MIFPKFFVFAEKLQSSSKVRAPIFLSEVLKFVIQGFKIQEECKPSKNLSKRVQSSKIGTKLAFRFPGFQLHGLKILIFNLYSFTEVLAILVSISISSQETSVGRRFAAPNKIASLATKAMFLNFTSTEQIFNVE